MLDLSQLSKYRENNRIEAKKAQGGLPHSIWETYSAFANAFGGYILLGVVENADKSFSSVPLSSPEKLVADFWNSVNNHSIVNVNILSDRNVQIVESGGNQIVVIEVPAPTATTNPSTRALILFREHIVGTARAITAVPRMKYALCCGIRRIFRRTPASWIL